MSKLNIKQKILFLLVVLFTGTGLVAQNGSREEFIDPPDEIPTLDLKEILGPEHLKVWATTGALNLRITNQSFGEVEIQVYDISGRIVISEKKLKTDSQFDFQYDSSFLPSSIYIVRIGQVKDLVSKKLYL